MLYTNFKNIYKKIDKIFYIIINIYFLIKNLKYKKGFDIETEMSNIAFIDIQKQPFLYHLDSSNNKIRVLFNGTYCYMAYLIETNINIYIPIPYFELPHHNVVLPQNHILGLLNSSYKPQTKSQNESGQKRKIGGGSSFQLITEIANQEKIENNKNITVSDIEILPPPLPKKNKVNEHREMISSFARINTYLKQNPDEKIPINESNNKNNDIQNNSISSFSFMKSVVKDAINKKSNSDKTQQSNNNQPLPQQHTVINNTQQEVIVEEIEEEVVAEEVDEEVVAEEVDEEVVVNEPNMDDCIIQALLLFNKK